ncbi:MAG: FAD-dependent oxidoreductase [Phycisphaerales bacterium]
MHTSARTIVIVGGVAGGATAAARARRCNETANIILLEKDEYVSFANCGLPYHIGGEIPDRNQLLVATPARFRDWLNVDVRTRHECLSINRPRKSISVKNHLTGETYELSYDRLILSPGASPIIPPATSAKAVNIFTLRNLADTDAILRYLEDEPRKVAVIGAGFIGLEMVEMLHKRGMEVTLVELQPQVMPPLDDEMARLVEAELKRNNITLHLGTGLKDIRTVDNIATQVVLDNGTTVDTDMVILSIGVRPNTKLAADAGLQLGNSGGGGITVNQYMQTSDPLIYAAGDAVEYTHGITQQTLRIPLAGPANRAGRIAGEHAATDNSPPMAPVFGTSIVRVFNATAGMAGISGKTAEKLNIPYAAVWVPARHHSSYYPGSEEMLIKLLYAPDTAPGSKGKILGVQIVGGAGVDKRIDVIATAMHFGGTVNDLTELDLAYAPPFGSAKDPVHLAAFVAQNTLRKLDRTIPPQSIYGDHDQVQWIDVRNPAEWQAGHLTHARWIPLNELRKRIGEIDPKRPVVTICRAGQRSYYATRILRQHGCRDVATLSGGMFMANAIARP